MRRDRDPKPTVRRGFSAPDHRAPSGKHARGREQASSWKGTARTVDRPAKRRVNARSWRKLLNEARRETVAARNRERALAAIDAAERVA